MRIGIDIDNVIANTQPILEKYAVNYNDNVVKRGLRLHERKGVTYEMFDWTKDENDNFCLNHLQEAVLQAELRPQALEIIKKLHDSGHFIAIISARAKPVFATPYESTEKWLHEKGVPYDVLIVGTTDKKSECVANHLDCLIEDENKYIEEVSEIIPVIIMDHPWNENAIINQNIYRAKDWREVQKIIKHL